MKRRRVAFIAMTIPLAVVAACLRLAPRAIDPRAMTLLKANDERLRTLHSVAGEVEEYHGATSRQTLKIQLMRPAFTHIYTNRFEKKAGSASWLPGGYSSLLQSDGKTIWDTQMMPGGKRRGARFPTSPQMAGIGVPIFFIGMFRTEMTYYGWLTNKSTNNDEMTVRYEGVQQWRGASYEAVRISGKAHSDPLAFAGVLQGRFSPVTWARTQIAAVPISHHYEYYLLIGADHLVHREIFTMRDGGPPVVVHDFQIQNVQINPPFSPSDFRYAPRVSGGRP